MSQALTLARPYARAAFALARQASALPQWSAALSVAAQLAADPRIAALIAHPNLGSAEAAGLVAPPSCDAAFLQFLDVLAENDRIGLLPEIAGQYERLRAEAEHVVRAKVTSATALDDAERSKIEQALRRRFNAEVALELVVDPALIGGAVIDTGDLVIDGSVRSKLARLTTALTH
jgi:F-type H+-transporting ATPase subunit delta